MPTYQYSCTGCGEQLEVVQSFSDPALTVCPACQGRLRKVFNTVGIVFKGSGFYRTDSRSGANGADKTNGASGDSPATKTEPSTSATPAKSESSSTPTSSSTSSTTATTAGAASG